MRVSDLIDRVYRITQYEDQFHMIDLFNEAQNILADAAKLEKVELIEVVGGQGAYPLPVTYKAPRTLIEGALDDPLRVYPLIDYAEMIEGYTIYGNELIIRPTPSSNRELYFYFYAYPDPLESLDDTPEIETQFHDLLSDYAIANLLPIGEAAQWKVEFYQNKFENGKRRLLHNMNLKTKQRKVRRAEEW